MPRHLAAAAITVLAAMNCSSPTALPERDPGPAKLIVARDVRTSISEDRPTIHVKEDVDEECGVIFTIREDTAIVERTNSLSLVAAGVDDLDVGRTVHVWAVGNIVLESCPGQATAEAVELLPE